MSLSKIFVNNTQVVGVDSTPISGSDNLIKSGGIAKKIDSYLSISQLVDEVVWPSKNSYNSTLIELGSVSIGDKFVYKISAEADIHPTYFGIFTSQPRPNYESTVAPMIPVDSAEIVNNEKEFEVTIVEDSVAARVFIWLNGAEEDVNINFSITKIYGYFSAMENYNRLSSIENKADYASAKATSNEQAIVDLNSQLSIYSLIGEIAWPSYNKYNSTLIELGSVSVGDKFIYKISAEADIRPTVFGIYTAQPYPAYESTVVPTIWVNSSEIVNNEKEFEVTVVEESRAARVFIWLNNATEGITINFSIKRLTKANINEINENANKGKQAIDLAKLNTTQLVKTLGYTISTVWESKNNYNLTLIELGSVSVGDIITYRISSESDLKPKYFGIYTAQPYPAYESTVAPIIHPNSPDIVNNEKEYTVVAVESSSAARAFLWLNDAIEGITINFSVVLRTKTTVIQLDERVSTLEGNVSTSQTEIINKEITFLGCKNIQKPVSDIELVVMYGQSLAAGQQTGPSVTRTNYKDNLMLGASQWVRYETPSSFNPLVSSLRIPADKNEQSNVESPIVNIANAAKRLLDNTLFGLVDRKYCASNCAVGGCSIEILSKNNPNNQGALYNYYINILNNFKRLSEADNKTYNLSAICWMQGEYNATSTANQGWEPNTPSTNNREDYKKLLIGGTTSDNIAHKGLVYDMMEDAISILGQEYNPIFLSTQIGYPWDNNFEQPIAMSFVDAQRECKDITIVSPNYRVTDRGGHLDANGSRWIGEFFAKVYYYKVLCGIDWRPLRPILFKKVSERYIEIAFDVPVKPLKFDTNQVRPVTNYGFSVKKNGSEVTIKDIDIIASDIVRLELESVLTEDEIEVSYGKLYGNLCDSDDWEAFAEYKDMDDLVENPEGVSYRPTFEPKDKDGNIIYNKKYPCENFCLRFYYKINSGQNTLYVY